MRWTERYQEKRRARGVVSIAVIVALLSFAIRFYWVMRVQSPFDAIDSDMAAYHQRAVDVVDGVTKGDARPYAFFPWGAHVLIAGELALFGKTSLLGVAFAHALVSTIPPVCVVFLSTRVVRWKFLVALAGLVGVLWQPQIVHTGYFMSEMWFAAALSLGTLFFVRFLEGKSGATAAGCALAIASVVRPQVLVAFVVFAALFLFSVLVQRVRSSLRGRTSWRGWCRFLAPIAAMLLYSAIRFHHLTGHYGLVSENGAVNRVFGTTHVATVEATWEWKNGRYGAGFTPPEKVPEARPENIVRYHGYIGDAELLDQIRIEHEKRETTLQRWKRMHANTKLLIYRKVFPEDAYAHRAALRISLQRAFRLIVVNFTPIAAIGVLVLLFARKTRHVGLVFAAHAISVIVVAALYFSEARMRMPYDAFLIVATTAGAGLVVRIGLRVRRIVLERLGYPT